MGLAYPRGAVACAAPEWLPAGYFALEVQCARALFARARFLRSARGPRPIALPRCPARRSKTR